MDFGILIPFFAIGGGLMIPISAIWFKHRERIEQMRMQSTAQVSAEKAAQYVGRVDEVDIQAPGRVDRGTDRVQAFQYAQAARPGAHDDELVALHVILPSAQRQQVACRSPGTGSH